MKIKIWAELVKVVVKSMRLIANNESSLLGALVCEWGYVHAVHVSARDFLKKNINIDRQVSKTPKFG